MFPFTLSYSNWFFTYIYLLMWCRGWSGGMFAYWSGAVVHILPDTSQFFIRLISGLTIKQFNRYLEGHMFDCQSKLFFSS